MGRQAGPNGAPRPGNPDTGFCVGNRLSRRERRIDKTARTNEGIRVREVRLIDGDGSQVGIVPIEEALRRAKEQLLDLVEVAPEAKPPVCRVMDFGKFLYQQKKKTHDSRKKQKTIQVKEVKFRPNIDDHDYTTKLKNAIRFLEEGDKVKATIQFRGREMSKPELGLNLLRRLTADIGEHGNVEGSAEMNGNRMHLIVGPGKKHAAKKLAPGAPAPAAPTAPRTAAR